MYLPFLTLRYSILTKQVDASTCNGTKMPLVRHLRTGGLKCHLFGKIEYLKVLNDRIVS